MGTTAPICASSEKAVQSDTSAKKELKPILHVHRRQKTKSEGDVPSEEEDAVDASPSPRAPRRRCVTFCAPEENRVYICPPAPGRPWTSKAKRFVTKFFTAHSTMPAQKYHQSVGIPGAGILSF